MCIRDRCVSTPSDAADVAAEIATDVISFGSAISVGGVGASSVDAFTEVGDAEQQWPSCAAEKGWIPVFSDPDDEEVDDGGSVVLEECIVADGVDAEFDANDVIRYSSAISVGEQPLLGRKGKKKTKHCLAGTSSCF